MSTTKISSPSNSAQPEQFLASYLLNEHRRAAKNVAEARLELIASLNATMRVLTGEIATLQATGDLSDKRIEKAYEATCFAIDRFREEQEILGIFDEEIKVAPQSSFAGGSWMGVQL